jgi:hypothetical protein
MVRPLDAISSSICRNINEDEEDMPEAHSIPRALTRKYLESAILAAAALLLVGNATWADDGKGGKGNEAGDDRAVRLLKVVPVPVSADNNTAGGLYSFDIAWVDQASEIYYLADRSNRRVDILDAAVPSTVTQLKASPSFAGVSPPAFATTTAGPNGVVTGGHCLFVTDAPSRVVSFDTTSFPPTQVSDVHTAAADPDRADELAFDPKDSLLLVINNADTPPFGTFIKVNPATCALTQPAAPPPPIGPAAGRIVFDVAHGVDAQNGAEQPVWEPVTGKFYVSIPQIGATASHGGVVRITPNATSVAAGDIIGVDFCSPAGLTVGPRQDLFIGCNAVFDTAGNVWNSLGKVTAAPKDVIIDAKTGKKDPGALDANVYGVGAGDEVTFNAGDGNYYATGSGSPLRPIDVTPAPVPPATTVPQTAQGSTPMGVVDSKDQKILQQLTTFNTAAVSTGPASGLHPAGTAHSVAADNANSHVFVALGANNAFSAFAVPGGGPVPDCETGCIAIYAHPDED